MLDRVLGLAIIWLPIALTVAFIFVPARSEDAKQHMKWRYWLVAFAVMLGALSWWQQSRALRASANDREDAIQQTSQKVAAATSASVTRTVTDLYSSMISDQKAQIAKLQSQLAAQGKDVSVIKGSNIVTGKSPIKVEVTNGIPNTTSAQIENVRLSWETEPSTHNDAPFAKKVTIQADAPVNPVRLAIFCDVPIKYAEGGLTGPAMYYGGNEISQKDQTVFIVNMSSQGTALLRPDSPLVFHLYSDKPINILRGELGSR